MSRIKITSVLIGIAASLMVAGFAEAVPLSLLNGGFEAGTATPTTSAQWVGSASSLGNWKQWANNGSVTTSQESGALVVEGSYSAHIEAEGTSDGIFQYGFWDAGTYTISGWVYVESGTAGIGLASNGKAVGFDYSTTTNAWEYLTLTATFSSSWSGGALVYSGTRGVTNSFYADGFWVSAGEASPSPYDPSRFNPNAVPEPGTLLLLGSGILGLGLIRRTRNKLQA